VKDALKDRSHRDVVHGSIFRRVVGCESRSVVQRSAREEVERFAERAEANERERIAYLRSLAVLSDFEGDTERAIDHLREAHTLAQKIGVPGELWQIQSRLGDLHERRGEETEAQKAYSLAAQTLRELAQKIENEELREGFLSAPQARHVLERS
jgi:tetratricopeptide (TPR) repeat protein